MDDYKSGLPIRTEADGTDERVHVKLVNHTDPDAAGNKVRVSEELVHIRNFGQHPKGTKVEQQFSEEGFTNGRGDYDAITNEKPNSVGLVAHVRNSALTLVHQVMRLTAIKSTKNPEVTALDVAIRDEQGNPYSANNPMPVAFEESEGSEVHDYNESATNVVKDASDEHLFTVPADKVFLLDQIMCSCSGRSKFLIEVGDVGTEISKGVRFTSSSSNDSDWAPKRTLSLTAGQVVRVTRLNRDNQPLGLYSTIVGVLKDAII